MDLDTVSKKFKNGEYSNLDQYPYPDNSHSREHLKELRQAWRDKNRRLEAKFCDDIAQSFIDIGITKKAASLAANYCWQEGHSSGLYCVLNHAWDIFPILEAQVEDPKGCL